MKRNILTLFILFAFVFSASAQFTFKPVTEGNKGDLVSGTPTVFELIAHGFVKNTSATKKRYVWRATRKNFPTKWTAGICDKNQCYDVVVDRAEFELNAGDSSNIDVHLYPKNISGRATTEIEVFEKGDSANGKKQDFEFNAWVLGVEDVKQNNIKIYPNPVTTHLNISLETTKPVKVEVYNVLGQLKKTHIHTGATSAINVNDLAVGIYFLRYTTEEGRVISKQFKKSN